MSFNPKKILQQKSGNFSISISKIQWIKNWKCKRLLIWCTVHSAQEWGKYGFWTDVSNISFPGVARMHFIILSTKEFAFILLMASGPLRLVSFSHQPKITLRVYSLAVLSLMSILILFRCISSLYSALFANMLDRSSSAAHPTTLQMYISQQLCQSTIFLIFFKFEGHNRTQRKAVVN